MDFLSAFDHLFPQCCMLACFVGLEICLFLLLQTTDSPQSPEYKLQQTFPKSISVVPLMKREDGGKHTSPPRSFKKFAQSSVFAWVNEII